MLLNKKKLEEIEQKAERICKAQSCLMYDLEVNAPSRLLRLYIDSEAPEGVSLDDCSNVSKEFSQYLDTLELGDVAYDLEVSSPGVERTLRKLWHYEKAMNAKIDIRLQQSLGRLEIPNLDKKLEKAKKLIGQLKAANEDYIEMEVEDTHSILRLPFKQITKANIVFDF